uniref:Fe2OG dioxygenase domain-containing protein n=1 Tax=Oryza punctata TaxID=4537 RepID=A0A0E0LUL6_ORYPU
MATVSGSDRLRDLHAFDDTKAGVKGLVDAGVTAVPYFFRHKPDPLPVTAPSEAAAAIPVIDLANADVDRRRVVAEVRAAAETVGFFQLVNHSVAGELMDEMLAAVRRFNEQPLEAKVPYYTRDVGSKVRFNSNFDLFRSPAANWRDTLVMEMAPEAPSPEQIPPTTPRRLGERLFELLSEALGLPTAYLGHDAGCMDGMSLAAHYYPPCPEPEETMGTSRHSDPSFLIVLLQDTSGGLQALLEGPRRWVDVPPVAGALVVNVGYFLHLVSNDRLRSVEHRVVATAGGGGPARVSVACFFRFEYTSTRSYSPIVADGIGGARAAVYRSMTAGEFLARYNGKGLDGRSPLDHFRLPAAAESPISSATSLTHFPSLRRRKPRQPSPSSTSPKVEVDRDHVASQVRAVVETVGFFQVVKHGVIDELMDEMLVAVWHFNEEPQEAKVPYYTRDVASMVRFNSNFNLFLSTAANWCDTLVTEMSHEAPSPEQITLVCRGVALKYTVMVRRLRERFFKLLSEALGLPTGYMGRDAKCMDRLSVVAHYYPACP